MDIRDYTGITIGHRTGHRGACQTEKRSLFPDGRGRYQRDSLFLTYREVEVGYDLQFPRVDISQNALVKKGHEAVNQNHGRNRA